MRRPALLCLSLVLCAAAPEQQGVRVQQMPDPPPGSVGLRGEQRYSLTSDDITATLSYVPTSLLVILRTQGGPTPMMLTEQASLLEPLLARLLQDHPEIPHLNVLLADNREIVSRLAAVLASCADWNGATGRPAQGGALGPFLVDTLNRHDLAGEIASVFARHGYRFSATGASMIVEGRVSKVTDRLVPIGISSLSFVADLSPETQRRTSWPTRFHRSTC